MKAGRIYNRIPVIVALVTRYYFPRHIVRILDQFSVTPFRARLWDVAFFIQIHGVSLKNVFVKLADFIGWILYSVSWELVNKYEPKLDDDTSDMQIKLSMTSYPYR